MTLFLFGGSVFGVVVVTALFLCLLCLWVCVWVCCAPVCVLVGVWYGKTRENALYGLYGALCAVFGLYDKAR